MPFNFADFNFLNWEFSYYLSAESDSVITVHFSHPQLSTETGYSFSRVFKNEIIVNNWWIFSDTLFQNAQVKPQAISTLDTSHTNCLLMNLGKGKIILHSNPILFTNYFARTPNGLEHAEKIFSHLTPGNIIWETKNWNNFDNSSSENNLDFERGPFDFLVSQKELRWALYLAIGLAFIYLLFSSKRKQRIIPVKSPKTNTSLEFVKTIGALYYQKEGHRTIIDQRKKVFYHYVRKKYRINLQVSNEENLNLLTIKSNYPKDKIKYILYVFNSTQEVNSESLIRFYNALELFYKSGNTRS